MTGTAGLWLILLTPLAPLLVAGLAALPRARRRLPALALAAPLPALAAALLARDAEVGLPWLLLGTQLGLDGTGRAFLLLFAALWTLGGWHAFAYLRQDARRSAFTLWFLLAMAGNLGLAVAQDALTFYVFFALMSFASYGLVVHDRKPESLRAGRVYMGLVVTGELALFSGIVLAVAAAGAAFDAPRAVPPLALALLAVGFGIKAGLVPLHVWLPLAHPAAPVPASAVLSGAMIKAGLLGALRFLPLPGPEGAGEALVLVGAASALFGVAVGVVQTNPKALLAYSSISQTGLVAIGLGLALLAADPGIAAAAVAATILFALHHGLAKASLFFGTAIAPGGSAGPERALRLLGLALPALALAAAPLTSGAIAKSALKAIEGGPGWLDLFLSLSSVATTVLLVRFLALMAGKTAVESRGIVWPWAASVVVSTLAFWLLPQAADALGYALTRPALIDSLWPVLAGLALGTALASRLRAAGQPLVPPGDLLALGRPLGSLASRAAPATRPAIPPASPVPLAPTIGAWLRRVEERSHAWAPGAALTGLVASLLAVSLLWP